MAPQISFESQATASHDTPGFFGWPAQAISNCYTIPSRGTRLLLDLQLQLVRKTKSAGTVITLCCSIGNRSVALIIHLRHTHKVKMYSRTTRCRHAMFSDINSGGNIFNFIGKSTSSTSAGTVTTRLYLGPLFTIKTPSYGYKNPHYKPKTFWWPSQVYNRNPYANKTVYC